MDQASFEQAVIESLRAVPEQQRGEILRIVRAVVDAPGRTAPGNRTGRYSVERHDAIRERTSTIRGSLAATVSVERDERG
jgi:hypothetical protein